MVETRLALPADQDAIVAIWLDAWRVGYRGIVPNVAIRQRTDADGHRYWTAVFANPSKAARTLVAVGDDRGVVGFAQAGTPDDGMEQFGYDAELWKLYIPPIHQGQGIGRQLMIAMACQLLSLGDRSMVLRAFAGNNAARFYARMGGTHLGDLPYFILGVTVPTAVFAWPDLTLLAQLE
jgi:GNAT superfamily N-acetyltransferase